MQLMQQTDNGENKVGKLFSKCQFWRKSLFGHCSFHRNSVAHRRLIRIRNGYCHPTNFVFVYGVDAKHLVREAVI